MAEKRKETTGEMIRSVLFAIAIALVFRSLAYEPFHIPSSSMYSTLYVGDYVFISKSSYGYSSYSFPLSLPLFEGRLAESKPERGDVVVFRNPDNTRVDYIKRVIGLPGDTVQMKHGRLFINGKLVEQTLVGESQEKIQDELGNRFVVKAKSYRETLPGGREHIVLDRIDNGPEDNTVAHLVPPGHYFMMGDNRDNSQDSRYAHQEGFLDPGTDENGQPRMGVGFVPFENFVGRATIIGLSYDTDVPFWQFWHWVNAFRGDRFVKKIQ